MEKPIRQFTVSTNFDGDRVTVGLFLDGGVFRWFAGEPMEAPQPCDRQDTEVSGKTVKEACRRAKIAWGSPKWDFQASW